MSFLSPSEARTLAAICDALVPSLPAEAGEDAAFFARAAADLDLAAHVETALEQITSAADQTQIRLVMAALGNPLFNQFTAGRGKAFAAMTQDEREATLRAWSLSPIPAARKAFQMFKRMGLFLFYSLMPGGQPNPAWAQFRYTLPAPVDTPRPLHPIPVTGDTTLTCDALVIGSGAGGGVVAAELSAAGLGVLVVEKGGYYAERDFHGQELNAMRELYEKQGSISTHDLGIGILAGSTLGGGTTVNWQASLRTPAYVLCEWAHEYGFSAAESPAYAASLDAVHVRMNIGDVESAANQMNCILEEGAHKLGLGIAAIPRNTRGCFHDGDAPDAHGGYRCGFCGFGCRYGAKQGTVKTYLQDAVDCGARILVRAHVDRVLIERGAAVGAAVRVTADDGQTHQVTIKARLVVVAAGSLHTPALLIRSGLGNAHIGANLKLHPVSPIYGMFDQPVRGWTGAPMTRITTDFNDLDGEGYGVRLETAPIHPGLGALATAWRGGRQHKRVMQQFEHLSNIIAITRDKHGGRVTVDAAGDPVIHYRLHPHDARHLLRGVLEALRIAAAAGAYEIASPHNAHMVYYPRPEAAPFPVQNRYPSLEAFLSAVETAGIHTNRFAVFSAHQMASCRIAGSPALGAVKPDGETWEVRHLYVTDGSAMPTASGVNPMVSIMGLAHYLAQRIKA
ncbi:MAG: GMC family oxidoreductase N-terminal domain-containing protein [bacterium]|nr:GMC family oxidoreductase N-terminal domain-containing protein [bacterium]